MITEVTVWLPRLSLEIIIWLAAIWFTVGWPPGLFIIEKGLVSLAVCRRWWVDSISINGLVIALLYIQSLIIFTKGKG